MWNSSDFKYGTPNENKYGILKRYCEFIKSKSIKS